MIPRIDSVQNQAAGSTVQPSSIKRVNAADMRLLRRLSKIFHWDSLDKGFF